MKICQLCAVDFTVEKFLRPLIDGFQGAGHQVIIVCSDGEYVERLRGAGYHVSTLSISRSFNVLKHAYSVWSLYRYFKREKFDLIHVHTPVASLVGRVAAKMAGVPMVVYTAHGFYFHDRMPVMKRKFHVQLERWAGSITDILFTQSSEDAKTAIEEGIHDEGRVYAIGNGVDATRFGNFPKEDTALLKSALGIPNDAIVIGMVGRLVEEKGLLEFLQSATHLLAEHPTLYVLLVGQRLVSDYNADVEFELISAKQIMGDRLVITGMRDDIPELMALMDIFCLPSWREGMPRTIIEAMMSSKAVVATNIRGSREEVVDGETGLLVPVKNKFALIEALNVLICDESLRNKMGVAGRLRAEKVFDERKVVEKQLKIIKHYSER